MLNSSKTRHSFSTVNHIVVRTYVLGMQNKIEINILFKTSPAPFALLNDQTFLPYRKAGGQEFKFLTCKTNKAKHCLFSAKFEAPNPPF